jgi:predicted transcriptional regulator
MPLTQQELDRFYEFACEVIRNRGSDVSLDELIAKWRAAREREDVNAAIREGIDDLGAGRMRPAEDVTNDLRKKYRSPA